MTKPALQVWWIPQIPMTAFTVDMPDIATGVFVLKMLAEYDQFQLDHNVKPDYSNAGGLRWRHPEGTDGEWYDLDPSDEYDVAEFQKYDSI